MVEGPFLFIYVVRNVRGVGVITVVGSHDRCLGRL